MENICISYIVVSPTKQQEEDMTDAIPVYQRTARIIRATTSQIVAMDTQEVHLEASPVAYKQPCPSVIRNNM